jgi:hypothetical protein
MMAMFVNKLELNGLPNFKYLYGMYLACNEKKQSLGIPL